MDKEYWEQKHITVYWWNGSTKTLDFKGTYKDFLKEKGITARRITSNGAKGWHFKIPLAFCSATYDTFDADYDQCCNTAIKVFLTILGDKATFDTPRFKYYLNWRP
jgi:hypothetical protein